MFVRARKQYVCDVTGKTIVVGESYLKMTVGGAGIMRFKASTTEKERSDAIRMRIFKASK